ncbi:hypothetical protein [Magnetospirillum sp. 64-120]|uniref:hypothetical protein n=1 Tax=Magnetospirillum sp. 64-120 TaxID=1895778 RepID=UPI00092BE1D2|nr:hypothetical protein [Magnetospirillum sp. 64-120]OJX81308.1 MAG: hypothetical protein BGO92_07080 [Magnetospirillum sp. 64-120]
MKRALFACFLAMMAPSVAWADQASAIAAVRGQPRVVDVSADNQGNMFVLVKAENITWNQYAAYLCKVVAPHQARIFNIRIIELTKAIRTQPAAKWDRLGNAACAN